MEGISHFKSGFQIKKKDNYIGILLWELEDIRAICKSGGNSNRKLVIDASFKIG